MYKPEASCIHVCARVLVASDYLAAAAAAAIGAGAPAAPAAFFLGFFSLSSMAAQQPVQRFINHNREPCSDSLLELFDVP